MTKAQAEEVKKAISDALSSPRSRLYDLTLTEGVIDALVVPEEPQWKIGDCIVHPSAPEPFIADHYSAAGGYICGKDGHGYTPSECRLATPEERKMVEPEHWDGEPCTLPVIEYDAERAKANP